MTDVIETQATEVEKESTKSNYVAIKKEDWEKFQNYAMEYLNGKTNLMIQQLLTVNMIQKEF